MPKNQKSECPTCGHVTNEYVFSFSVLDALLLIAMAKAVRKRIADANWDFTRSNKVHIPTLGVPYNIAARMTITSKLGLIAKYKVAGHQEQGMWVITARGWAALRGELVPSEVRVFRKEITDRPGSLTTLASAMRTYPGSDYVAAEWFDYGREVAPKNNAQLL